MDTSANNVFDHCAIKHAYTGIEAASAVGVYSGIYSCVISEFTNDGIKAIGAAVTIDDCEILLGNTGTRGIELVSSNGSSVSNNTITGSASGMRYGIVSSGGVGANTVTQNRIEDVRTGIRAYGTSHVQVIDNILDGNASTGISAEESCVLTVRGNSIEGYGYYGVAVKNYADVNMNAEPESGNNRIPKGAPATNYCVLNKITADTVEARELFVEAAQVASIRPSTSSKDMRLLLKFELPAALVGRSVDFACVSLDASPGGTKGTVSLEAFRVTTDWDASSVAWSGSWANDGGDWDADVSADWVVGESGDKAVYLDVTDFVNAWLAEPARNFGIISEAGGGDMRNMALMRPRTYEPPHCWGSSGNKRPR